MFLTIFNLRPITFSADNNRIYWQWGAGSDLGCLVIHDFGQPNNSEILYSAKRAEIGSVIFHPTDRTFMAITEVYHKPNIYVTNTTILEDIQILVNSKPTATLYLENMSQGEFF